MFEVTLDWLVFMVMEALAAREASMTEEEVREGIRLFLLREGHPLSPLTDPSMFAETDDAVLADWLLNDAKAMDGMPGYNNHVAATRAAAERLRRDR